MKIIDKYNMKIIDEYKRVDKKKKDFCDQIKQIKFSYTGIDTIEKLLEVNNKELDKLIIFCDNNIKKEAVDSNIAGDKTKKKSITSKYLKEIKDLANNLKLSFSDDKLSINTLTKRDCSEELGKFIKASENLRFKFFEISREKFFKHPTAAFNYGDTKEHFEKLGNDMIYCLSRFQGNLRRESIKILVNAINGGTSTTMSESKFIYIPHVNCINVDTIELKKDNLEYCANKAYDYLRVGFGYDYIDKKDWKAITNCVHPTQYYYNHDFKDKLPIKK